jgi:hypothetical protein
MRDGGSAGAMLPAAATAASPAAAAAAAAVAAAVTGRGSGEVRRRRSGGSQQHGARSGSSGGAFDEGSGFVTPHDGSGDELGSPPPPLALGAIPLRPRPGLCLGQLGVGFSGFVFCSGGGCRGN